MEKRYVNYTDIERLYALPQDRVLAWVEKGYVSGEGVLVEKASLEAFLQDIGTDGWELRPRMRTSLSLAWEQFVKTWPMMLGEELGGMLHRCTECGDLGRLADDYGISVPTLKHYLRTATSLLGRYYADVPEQRKRLAHLTRENRRLERQLEGYAHLQLEKGEAERMKVVAALMDDGRMDRGMAERTYRACMDVLKTPVTRLGLSVRCTNAAVKSGVETLMDFIIIHKACGKSGMLTKCQHFGLRSYQEVEQLLVNLGLVRVDDRGEWTSPFDDLVDTEHPLYVRYCRGGNTVQPGHRVRSSEQVAEWIGNFLAATGKRPKRK